MLRVFRQAVKRIGGGPAAQGLIGRAAAAYLEGVRRTNRFVIEPPDAHGTSALALPVILAMWHGQHFMVHFARIPGIRVASLVSRSRDGNLNASLLRHVGVRAIRGSGARGRDPRAKGGAQALRLMLRALDGGETVAMTADVPKVSRRCGRGIVTLAQLSGRPILPIAVVTSRRVDIRSWDSASLGLPFGRGAIVIGEAIWVERTADAARFETIRLAVEAELDRVHARAYGLIESPDPGLRRPG